jgi:sugar-specific transcriptional regulator TrmB
MCQQNSDCGTETPTGTKTCCETNLCQAYKTYECINPGQEDAYCQQSQEQRQTDACEFGCSQTTGEEAICNNCSTGWRCKDNTTKAYQDSDCTWKYETFCDQGCSNNQCIINQPDINITCENCINVTEKAIQTINAIKQELMLSAQKTDKEVGNTEAQYTACLVNVLIQPSLVAPNINNNENLKMVFKQIIDDNLKVVYNEHPYENLLTQVYFPELDKIADEIQKINLTEVNNTEFAQDILTYYSYVEQLQKEGTETVDEIITSGNTMKFNLKLILLGGSILKMLVIGSMDTTSYKIFRIITSANGAGGDLEDCILENQAQLKINQVLDLTIQGSMLNSIYHSGKMKNGIEYLNLTKDYPSISISKQDFDPIASTQQFTITNTFSNPITVDTYYDLNVTANGYCGANDIKELPITESETVVPVKLFYDVQKVYKIEYYPEIAELLTGYPLTTLCPIECDLKSTKTANIEGRGWVYVLYGENEAIAAKKFPVFNIFRTEACSPPIQPTVYSGGGGGGGSSHSFMATSKPPAPATPPTYFQKVVSYLFQKSSFDFEILKPYQLK